MKKEIMDPREAASLRQKAEEKINKKHPLKKANQTGGDSLKLLHELEVYQVELEMQNDELRQARSNAITSNNKYLAFYDFAYTGYFTLNPNGKIAEVNITGATMLGIDRSGIINRLFRQFVTLDSVYQFDEFIKKIFKTKSKETCELRLLSKGKQAIFIYVEGIISEDEKECHITVVDITKRKNAEDLLNLRAQEIKQFDDLMDVSEKSMIELKKEINQLLKKLGEKEKFNISQ